MPVRFDGSAGFLVNDDYISALVDNRAVLECAAMYTR